MRVFKQMHRLLLRRCANFLFHVVLATGIVGSPAFSQFKPVRANSFEFGGFVGSSYGIDKYRVMGGGNISYAISRRILPYVEYSYFPGLPRFQTTLQNGVRTDTDAFSYNLHDIHAGVHYRFTYRESKLVPYAVFGLGLLHSGTVEDTATNYAVPPGAQPQVTHPTFPGTTSFAVNFGGGLRYYFDQRWGIRAEAKAYKPTGTFNQTFGKVEFGVFYQK